MLESNAVNRVLKICPIPFWHSVSGVPYLTYYYPFRHVIQKHNIVSLLINVTCHNLHLPSTFPLLETRHARYFLSAMPIWNNAFLCFWNGYHMTISELYAENKDENAYGTEYLRSEIERKPVIDIYNPLLIMIFTCHERKWLVADVWLINLFYYSRKLLLILKKHWKTRSEGEENVREQVEKLFMQPS